MSLFKCTNCGCVENTACSKYIIRVIHKEPILCSECDPDIGKWHGIFPKVDADAEGYVPVPNSNFITKE